MEHPAYSQLRPVSQSVGVVLCDNPSYTALEGTNTWIIRAAEDSRAIVVDPVSYTHLTLPTSDLV